jgi:hypothetical protein
MSGEVRYFHDKLQGRVLEQFIDGVWRAVPHVYPDDTVSKPAPAPAPAAPVPAPQEPTPTAGTKVVGPPPPLPAKASDARDLDTLIAVLIGGRPAECHVTHIDQCTATVDLRDLMRVAGPEWQAKLRAIDEVHAANQAARIAREAKAEEDAKLAKLAKMAVQ